MSWTDVKKKVKDDPRAVKFSSSEKVVCVFARLFALS